ncbi:unnamed protein product [Owenia fusiformis]|uniref:Synaptogyrin n=1 Tax=Owenia fusiformis TaxID=6347 RepID=A0A8J1U5X4_OWEFU|nr:unnamed protein product [Owenia fusiformis]
MDGPSAFGAGMTGGAFDPIAFIKKPQVILRLVSWFFAIIIFGCISSQAWLYGICLYGGDANACSYGLGIAVIAFLICMAFIAIDALYEHSPIFSSVQNRKYAVIADMGTSALWTFLYFVSFCYLTNKWTTFDRSIYDRIPKTGGLPGQSGVQAAIAFTFFSIGTFGGLTFLAVQRYRSGAADAFSTSGGQSEYQQDPTQGGFQPTQQPSPYSSYPGEGQAQDPYQQQQPPFQAPADNSQQEYTPPTY